MFKLLMHLCTLVHVLYNTMLMLVDILGTKYPTIRVIINTKFEMNQSVLTYDSSRKVAGLWPEPTIIFNSVNKDSVYNYRK